MNQKSLNTISIVVPVYRNESFINELISRVESLHRQITKLSDVEFVFVIDGSPDNSEHLLRSGLEPLDVVWKILCHSRNFGSWAAIESGLTESSGSYFLVMSADLQEPEQLILNMANELVVNLAPLVVGTRTFRADGRIKDFFSNLAWKLVRKFTSPKIPKSGVDIFGCNRLVAEYLLAMRETNSSLVGKMYWLGIETVNIPYDRVARQGDSGWTFAKKYRYLSDSIFSFTRFPILVIQITGIFGIIATSVVSCLVLINWWSGGIQVSGYVPVMLTLGFGFSANLLAFGILGTYIWRIFENVKGRPRAVISRRLSSKTGLQT
jgi:glycosyltransferase involved in cell wall biosynthesis